MLGVKIADLFAGFRLDVDKSSWQQGDKLLNGLKTGLAAFAAWKGFDWAKGAIQQTVDLGGKISDLSQQVGVPAETLQQLGFAAEQSGYSLEGMGTSLGKLSKLAYDAKKGGKEAADAFKKVGVSVKGADGELRPAEDILADIADHIATLPDGTEKTAKTMALFGRSGKDLIPLLNEGSEGIGKLRQEFLDLGAQIDGETIDALEAFGDQQDRVKVAFDGIRNQAVIAVLPALRELVDGFLAWVKANRELIRQRLAQVFGAIVKVVKVLAKAFDVFMKAVEVAAIFLSNWFQIVTENWHLITQAAFAAAGAMAAFKWQAIQAALATMAAWAIPIAAIAGILLLVEDLWVWSKGGDSLLGALHKGAVDVFVKAIEFWVAAAQDFFTWAGKEIDKLGDKFRNIPRDIRDGFVEAFTGEAVNYNSIGGAIQDATRQTANAAARRGLSPEDAAFMRDWQNSSPVSSFRQDPANAARAANGGRPVQATFNISGVTDPAEVARLVNERLRTVLDEAGVATED